MRDNPGRTLAPRVVPAVAVGLALVLLAGVLVAALRPGTASAATLLERGDGVVAQLADGSSLPLAVGDEVPRGALVVAGTDGAVLGTRDRDTWLGGGSAVTVLDGARQELREGLVMVDARSGPGLVLTASAAEVTTPPGALSRVERGPLLRVGSYDGDPLSVRAAGRGATTPVARSYQVQVPSGGLPGRVTPLVLTPGDRYERALVPMLVAADEALGDVAVRLDARGDSGSAVRTAADVDLPQAALPAGAPPSERTLAYLLARAAGAGDGDGPVADRYADVRVLRGDGGSWGVVADLVQAEVAEVAAELDALLGSGDAVPVLAAEPLDLAELLGLTPPAPAEGPAAATAGTTGVPATAPGTGGGSTSSGAPASGSGAPAPPPSSPGAPPGGGLPGVLDGVVGTVGGTVDTTTDTVDTVVDTVVGLLPAPSSSSGSSPPSGSPSPAPSGGLLPLPLGLGG